MAFRTDPGLVTFASGVLSPKLLARSDIKQYEQGLLTSENFVVMPHGGLTRRPGTYYVAPTKFEDFRVRLIPFQFSTEQSYMIEAGHNYFRFYANSGRLESPPGTPVELATPWEESHLAGLQWAQTADVMYLVHPDFMPRKLTRTSATSFALSTVSFSNARAPLLALNQNPAIYPMVTGVWPNLTITMSQPYFDPADVGRTFYIRSTIDKNAYYMTIVGFTSSTIVTATGTDRFSDSAGHPNGPDADRWAFGAFDATHGCAAVCFHEGRLGYGGFTTAPDMIWLSASDDFDNFELTSPDAATTDAENDDKAIQRRAISGRVNSVRWMASGGTSLVIGTSGAEFRLKPANDDILSPLSAALKRATERGASTLPPAVIDNNIYYIDRSGTVLRQLKFDLLEDAEKSTDVSLLAEHLMLTGVREMAYQQSPIPTLWQVMDDGAFIGWSIESDQEVLAAHPHHLGGGLYGLPAAVESVGVIPGANVASTGAVEDQLWFVVSRTIAGVSHRYVERSTPYFRANLPRGAVPQITRVTAAETAFFVDSGLSLNVPIAVTGVSASTFATVTAPAHGLVNGDTIRFRGVRADPDADLNLFTTFEQKRFTVSNATADEFRPVDMITGLVVNTVGMAFLAPFFVYKEVSTVSGLNHLEGAEVAILTDGKLHPNRTVAAGAIALDLPASIIHIGLPYSSTAQTMPLAGQARGTDQGYQKSFGQTSASLMETIGGEYSRGEVPTYWEPMVFDNAGNLQDYGPPLLTGMRRLKFSGSPSDDLPTVHFRQTQALPFTLLGLFPRTWSNVD